MPDGNQSLSKDEGKGLYAGWFDRLTMTTTRYELAKKVSVVILSLLKDAGKGHYALWFDRPHYDNRILFEL